MANKINVKLILELRAAGLSRNVIAATRHIAKHSVSDVMHISDEKGITYKDVRSLPEETVYRMFYPDKFSVEQLYEQTDYEYVHQELKRVGVTLKLLWQEYQDRCKSSDKIPMGYTKFCNGYADYTVVNKLTNHLEHKPGIVTEVDWSGPTMSYVDTSTGEVVTVYLFVGTLPYSQYSYVEPTIDMKMDTFIRCHIRMYEYFEGVTTRLICDNLKTGVVSHPKDGEVILTADYEALGEHYMTAIMPAGVRKPKQKASVEGTVGKIATAIIAKLRNEMFYSFPNLKTAVAKKLYEFNHENFQKRDGSRYDSYLDEKPTLHSIPAIPYEIATWVYGRKVNIDYHVVFEYNRYSCPYQYAHKKVDLRVTDTTVEIYSGENRLTTHNRFPAGRKNQYATHAEDMPDKFKFSPWDDIRIKNWADSIGKYTTETVERIFESVSIKEQGYNPALAVLRLSNKYSEARLEAACEFAITNGIKKPRYHHLNSILAANQDVLYLESKTNKSKGTRKMGYLRGSDYYGGGYND
ncbi:MAG TPA: IS21 family transposase [Lachnospiraceae bacterium]|nr:IS21 family transposase [Lachnospiraceae bacterium]